MSVSTQGINYTNVIPVVHIAHKMLFENTCSYPHRNPAAMIPVLNYNMYYIILKKWYFEDVHFHNNINVLSVVHQVVILKDKKKGYGFVSYA